jgi:alanyl-tRNA synthetase
MGNAYPDVVKNREFVVNVIAKEEERFRQTLKTGLHILDGELESNPAALSGSTAFLLHDTYGFPLELTQEIAGERDVVVDLDGFASDMTAQRARAKAAQKGAGDGADLDAYRDVLEQFGVTEFLGYSSDMTESRVLAVIPVDPDPVESELVDIFLDRTPFYAESGGQIGDTGTITTETGIAEVVDTTFALPNLRRHRARISSGSLTPGQTATASIDADRRAAIRRNHTATHLLHHALRQVLGDHVKQAGSMVGPDRLRFDFSHYEAVTDAQITEIERLANAETLTNTPTRIFETTKDEAEALGAIAFFGDKYGDIVRVLEAGSSIELCGGTHVRATGDIGTIKVVSESSIGSNLRRIEAITGEATVALLQRDESLIADAARLLGSPDLLGGVQRKLDETKALQDEIKALRAQLALGRASELALIAHDGVVVTRIDGLAAGDLRELAIAVRQQPGIRLVVLIGETNSGGVGLVAAVEPGSGRPASELIAAAAKAVGGGGGGKGDIATAGGKDVSGIPAALELAAQAAALAVAAPA